MQKVLEFNKDFVTTKSNLANQISEKSGQKLILISNLIIRTNSSANSPFYRHSQKRHSVFRGKRFAEKVLDTGKKVDPPRLANPQKKRNRFTPGITFLPESAGSNSFHALYLPEPVGTVVGNQQIHKNW
jgi:hypothetical protein